MAINTLDAEARSFGGKIYQIVPFKYDHFISKIAIVVRQRRVEVTTAMLQTLMEGLTPSVWKKVSVRNTQDFTRHEFDVGGDIVKLWSRFKDERNGSAMMGGLVCTIRLGIQRWDNFVLYFRDEAKAIMMKDTGTNNYSEDHTGVCVFSRKSKYEGATRTSRLSDVWQNISSSLTDLLPKDE